MSLFLAEKFIELSDQHSALAKTYNEIADELSEAAALSHPAATGKEPEPESTEDEGLKGVDDKVAENQAAADKKKAAAAKRRATAKAKKDAAAAEAVEEAEAEAVVKTDDTVDPEQLLSDTQDLLRKYIAATDTDSARALIGKFDISRCSEAAGDVEKLTGLIEAFTEALGAEEGLE